jgi:UDP-N-acetylmuramoyl-tripeptide--D-alanyl-D-alanine ligase
MMRLDDAAREINGYVTMSGISAGRAFSDSRAIEPGGLFVALRGDRFDGHDFVCEVLANGAAAALVDRVWADAHGAGLPLLVVDDTLKGLGLLAAWWRSRFPIPLIGITGSNGKTTVKEMCAAILRAHFGVDAVLATRGNFNNHIGLPLTLLSLEPVHRAAVIEMGMNHPGEITYLTHIAKPTIALVNNAQRAHLEGLGSLESVARAKGEIFAGLGDGGTAVINADDPHAQVWIDLNQVRPMIRFGLDHEADMVASAHDGLGEELMQVRVDRETVDLKLPLAGRHNARNALAALAATRAAGVPLATAVAALTRFSGVKGRLQRQRGLHGALLIDDTYNANPDSMRAAIDVLVTEPGRRVFVMGDMGEVGETAGQVHSEIGGYAKSMGVDRLLCLGEHSTAAVHNFGAGAEHFTRIDDLVRAVKKELDAHMTVLVKGSRFMRMERVVDAIADRGEKKNAA